MTRIQRARRVGGCRLHGFVAMLAMVLAAGIGAPTRADVTTIFADNFQADTIGGLPGSPVIGLPWQLSESASGGLSIVSDSLLGGNALGFGLYGNTAAMPVSPTMQSLVNTNENLNLTLQYKSIAYNGYTPMFDVAAVGSSGLPAYFFRIMPQANPGSNLHEIYYLDPTSGLLDSGLSVAAGGTQTLTIAADFANGTSTLTVSGSSATLPLFLCPSAIGEVQMSSQMIGSGLPSQTLGNGYPVDIDNVDLSTQSADPGVLPPGGAPQSEPSSFGGVPEPAVLALLAAFGLAIASLWVFRKNGG